MNLKTKIVESTVNLGKEISKESPVILTVVGCTGVIGTAVLAAKATPKAMKLISEAEKKVGRKLNFWEKTKVTWVCYIPAGIVGAATIGAVIGSNRISEGRLETMAAAYNISETARKAYQEKVLEEVGPKKEEHIRSEVVKEEIQNNPPTENANILPEDYSRLEELSKTGKLYYENGIRGMYFECSSERVRNAERIINEEYIRNRKSHCATLNDFYKLVGLTQTNYGDTVGWNRAHKCQISLYPMFVDEDNDRGYCTGIDYDNLPIPEYDSEEYDIDPDYAPWECH